MMNEFPPRTGAPPPNTVIPELEFWPEGGVFPVTAGLPELPVGEPLLSLWFPGAALFELFAGRLVLLEKSDPPPYIAPPPLPLPYMAPGALPYVAPAAAGPIA
jgi:hypothetical protein